MQTPAEDEPGPNGFARVFDVLRQAALRAADAAVGAVRAQANEVMDAYRAELRRAVAVYLLCRAILLFVWSAAVFAALALEFLWWESHRTAVSLWVAAGFVTLAAVSAAIVARLTRRSQPTR